MLQAGLSEVSEELRHGSTEEQGLAAGREAPEDVVQLLSEAHLEQAVCFVEHHVLHGVQAPAHLCADVHQSTEVS